MPVIYNKDSVHKVACARRDNSITPKKWKTVPIGSEDCESGYKKCGPEANSFCIPSSSSCPMVGVTFNSENGELSG